MTLKVYLDPGHDARRPGCNYNGVDETALVHEVAVDVAAYLECWPYIETKVSRTLREDYKPYYARAREARVWGADIAICLHVNAIDDTVSSGCITFHVKQDYSGREAAEVLARCAPVPLHRDKAAVFEAEKGSWTGRAWSVMSHYEGNNVPVCLLELGYATNKFDADALTSHRVRPAICAQVGAACARLIEIRGNHDDR